MFIATHIILRLKHDTIVYLEEAIKLSVVLGMNRFIADSKSSIYGMGLLQST